MPTADRKILIFAKAPTPGFVKTRLTSALTSVQAADLYKAMALDTLEASLKVPDAQVCVAYHPHADSGDPAWLIGDSPVQWFQQEGNDLGERLAQATARLFEKGLQSVLVIGSDLPSLTAALLDEAFEILRDVPVVLGPSADGGYYLIGMREPHHELFQSIRWSESTVFKQTIAKLQALQLVYKCLPSRSDLDTPEDLRRLRADPSLVALEFQRTLTVLREI